MRISVRAFASYREALGAQRLSLDVPDGSTPEAVWERLRATHPRLAGLPQPHAFAVNDEYVAGGTMLRERDELVLIPPVSGGTGMPAPAPAASVELTERPIDVNVVLRSVQHPQAGAVVLFLGTVRDNNRARHVKHLEYEAYHRMALREMQRVTDEARRRWTLQGIAIVHRVGRLAVGEISVAIAVSSAHRQEAFEAGRFAIDTLKQTVPIWKKEVWEGGEVWVGTER